MSLEIPETIKPTHGFFPRLTMTGKGWYLHGPSWRDLAAALVIFAVIILLGLGARQMVTPFVITAQPEISLSPWALPMYTLRTVMRMLVALLASLLFTFIYATLAAKSRRAEMVLIPVLDILQSVPILGYLSFTVIFFISLFPGNTLGPEFAAIFAIFTSQAWNMTFSFYQSLRTVPCDLDESSRSFRLSAWQRFWRLEVPFAMPGLVWNMMMSMSGGWFFVVASEAITVGQLQIALPGVGSYVAKAIQERDLTAVGWAIAAMTIAILLYDQLLFRPLVAWSDKFRSEQTASAIVPRSWLLELFQRTRWLKALAAPFTTGMDRLVRARFSLPVSIRSHNATPSRALDYLWFALIAASIAYTLWVLAQYAKPTLTWNDLVVVVGNGFLTLTRVVILIALATLIWVPIGVLIGLRPKLAENVQPIAQFLAAFPANLFYPVAVYFIVHFRLNPVIWLSPLMILGTQWYILFNVIAGATAFPNDFREAAESFRVRGWKWWWSVMLPGIFPYYITGAITASGGAWNASIVSEVVSWGTTKLNGGGLGAYIADRTTAGDFPRIALGIAVMSLFVIVMNRLLWRPLYAFAEQRTRL